jgi:Transcriptional regulator
MSEITKRALEQSLKNLLKSKPLSKITISDIAADCGINRMTFYYHFRDIYDLIEWCCINDAKKALDNRVPSLDNWKDAFIKIFQSVSENRDFVLNVYHSISRDQIENYLYEVAYKLFYDALDDNESRFILREEDKKFIANFYKFAFVGIILEWVRDDMKTSPEKIVNQVECLVANTMDQACHSFQHRNFIN